MDLVGSAGARTSLLRPVYCTFRQSLEVVRTHCDFFTPDDLRLVLGGTLRGILAGVGAP